jgi:hypothetical protein
MILPVGRGLLWFFLAAKKKHGAHFTVHAML